MLDQRGPFELGVLVGALSAQGLRVCVFVYPRRGIVLR